jgi:hypothetical protein
MSHKTTSVWKCDLCPVEVESANVPHGWFLVVGNDGALELDLCGHCAMPIIAAYREADHVGNFAVPKIDLGVDPGDLRPYVTPIELPGPKST